MISSRRGFYEKLFAEGKCWPEDEVNKLRQKWYKVRPRPKGGFGPWAHENLEAQFGETEPDGPQDPKDPKPVRGKKQPAAKKTAQKR